MTQNEKSELTVTGIDRNGLNDEIGSIQRTNSEDASTKYTKGALPFVVLISTPDNAKDLDRRMKVVLTLIVSLAGMAAPLGSTILMRKL